MKGNSSLRLNACSVILRLVLFCFSCVCAQSEGDSILGQWYTEKCQAAFHFYCSGQEYKAKMVPLEKPDMVDTKNPVDSLKTRKLNGTTTIYGLVYNSKKKQWENGKVYNPEDGRTYSCYCFLKKGGTQLFFKGYLGVSVLGGSQIWTREKCTKGRR
ncbi:MAG: hypothetical protein A2268_07340 [Candidatus Raymondbacteria bacterium RifOxyA12_full_50_37]|uniref:DUF2147 domain-containing protein n=1 Tax=Candidatus Raymondbacteria bacterium RIFOXYD12_FULL_49_13 TaxID=1817890 RepID=A0A1F7FEG2_UNCRA|nr:MAG: hypothetical protein A2268_07340 [Candidatus Raymondbacteria bacterium RifOxyA12_full_50_37]OGJ91195.1 MAG: hypothetical protein A2248_01485 [Candidatus Raymondbacteria bacterium RIFOXYA2_FULL_49_16]OGJ93334.1 MAG: hypothetical protein A2350_20495 [Candidatus Raymondbacteria bacterium RifOxyB12_full_50_8]OGJ97593.1 MAG: hypothetical protein A2453_02250 [Candidatus Raymondbacteria bacterium RIFOXYC2_FULL_50_21]OGK05065.1 MAG: hypothetical protein A2519_10370 [Candidatus Raymondbacteria b